MLGQQQDSVFKCSSNLGTAVAEALKNRAPWNNQGKMSYNDAMAIQFQRLLTGGTSGLVTDKEHYFTLEEIRNQAKPGDILEFYRGDYTHYALYLGIGKVMNIDVESERVTEARVQERTLREVCHGGKVRVRNHEEVAKDHFFQTARLPSETVKTAKSWANTVVPYEHDFRNCEYYCTLWRYGRGFSTEVAKAEFANAARTQIEEPDPKGADYTKYKAIEVPGFQF